MRSARWHLDSRQTLFGAGWNANDGGSHDHTESALSIMAQVSVRLQLRTFKGDAEISWVQPSAFCSANMMNLRSFSLILVVACD